MAAVLCDVEKERKMEKKKIQKRGAIDNNYGRQ